MILAAPAERAERASSERASSERTASEQRADSERTASEQRADSERTANERALILVLARARARARARCCCVRAAACCVPIKSPKIALKSPLKSRELSIVSGRKIDAARKRERASERVKYYFVSLIDRCYVDSGEKSARGLMKTEPPDLLA